MDYREVYEEMVALFYYNPPPIHLAKDSDVIFSSPNMFYDRHLDLRLALKHIRHTPSLPLEISGLVMQELQLLKDKGQLLPLTHNENEEGCRFSTVESRETYSPPSALRDARSVAQFYSEASFENCAPIASTIALHPQAITWLTFMDFCEDFESNRDHSRPMVDNYILRIYHDPRTRQLSVPKPIWSCLSDQLRRDLRLMLDRFRTLAVFQFHAPLAPVNKLFQDMGRRAKEGRVPQLSNSVVDYVTNASDSPLLHLDSTTTIASLPSIYSSTQGARRSARLSSQMETRSNTTKNKSKGCNTWPNLSVKQPAMSRANSTLYIQQAWTRAVESDSTVIVFNCGNYERIGFRHRGSQTLFLSDLMEISSTSDPGYGQLQVGLYMVILRDALDRIRLINANKPSGERRSSSAAMKRKGILPDEAENVAVQPRFKKIRVGGGAKERKSKNPTSFKDTQLMILREVDRRDVALLRLEYGVFHSPSSMALYRTGRAATTPGSRASDRVSLDRTKNRVLTPEEYFRITLTSEIAQGATGKVHDAKIEVQMEDGRVHECLGVVKVALEHRKRVKLRHEYAVYRYMALKKVKGIATVYGLFEDAANEAMLLVMSHTGISLVKQPHYQEHGQLKLSDKEKYAFQIVMAEVHKAGIRHYDIRPENLMLDQQGQASIIDFDMAKVKAGQRSRQREFKHLRSLLDGRYDRPNQWSSPATSVSARSPPADDDILDGRFVD